MITLSTRFAIVLGGCLLAGMTLLGYQLGYAALEVKAHERSVLAKGLAEREVPADTAIWQLSFQVSSDSLAEVYEQIAAQDEAVFAFLAGFGLRDTTTTSPPSVWDRLANNYVDPANVALRYTGNSVHTVYTNDVDAVRQALASTLQLGNDGLLLNNANVQYLFTGLNDIKPAMIEQSTRNAREVAQKFAADSASSLGKIKSARQGQFSIHDRDSSTPHIKNVRVVSTIEYYLSD